MAGSGVVAYGARDYAAQRAREVEEENNRRRAGQANWNAMMTAKNAVASGLGGTVTTYSDPYTGANYRYAGGGGGSSSSGSGSGGGGGRTSLPPVGQIEQYLPKEVPRQPMPAHVAPPPKADRTAAEAAAYGRAKDQIGMNAGGALKALQRQMSARGIRGAGLEGAGLSALIGTAQGQLGQVSRDQAIQGLQRDYAVEDRNYAGDLSQRTGDMGWLTTERGQDIDQQQGRASLIPGLLRLVMSNQAGVAY
jgi:hypothetical protein